MSITLPHKISDVLIVEDEATIREPLANYFRKNRLKVETVPDANDARKVIEIRRFDIIILDVTLPDEDGLSLCRHIRETHGTPTILLSAQSDENDRIIGLEIGADDYVAKPFNQRELLARTRAVLRRSSAAEKKQKDLRVLAFGEWTLKINERVLVGTDGVATTLSTGEFNLLVEFAKRPGEVLSRETLLSLSRGRSATNFDRSIDNMISRLRRKIEPDPKQPVFIKTIWGGGYMFSAEVREE